MVSCFWINLPCDGVQSFSLFYCLIWGTVSLLFVLYSYQYKSKRGIRKKVFILTCKIMRSFCSCSVSVLLKSSSCILGLERKFSPLGLHTKHGTCKSILDYFYPFGFNFIMLTSAVIWRNTLIKWCIKRPIVNVNSFYCTCGWKFVFWVGCHTSQFMVIAKSLNFFFLGFIAPTT